MKLAIFIFLSFSQIYFLPDNRSIKTLKNTTPKSFLTLCPDTIDSWGYLVFIYKKTDIITEVKNKKRKDLGKSFSMPYDAIVRMCFIAEDSLLNKQLPDLLYNLSHSKAKEFFVTGTSIDDFFLKQKMKDCPQEIEINKTMPIWGDSARSFYALQKDKKHLYRIFKIRSTWLKVQLNREDLFQLIGINATCLDTSIPEYNVYIYDSLKEQKAFNESEMPGLYLWKTLLPFWVNGSD